MTRATTVFFVFGLALLILASGCGGSAVTPGSSSSSTTANSSLTPTTTSPTTTAYVTVAPSSVVMGAMQTQQFTAQLSNGVSAGFTWRISDCSGSCGTITSAGVYTAPPSVSKAFVVTIRATAQTDQILEGIGYAVLQPVTVVIRPSSIARLAADTMRTFEALVQYDPQNEGVTWSLSGPGCTEAACGTLVDATARSVIFHAPARAPDPPAIFLRATSITDSDQGATGAVVVTQGAEQYTLQGEYVFLIQGQRWVAEFSDGSDFAIAGHMKIGNGGNITGIWDANLSKSGGITELISGTYSVGNDGNGIMALKAGSGDWSFSLSIQSGGTAAVLLSDPAVSTAKFVVQSGYLLRQDVSALSPSAMVGDRVLALNFSNVAALGRFTAHANGTITDAVMDTTWRGCCMNFFTTSTVTGSYSAPDPLTGRGTASLMLSPGPDATTETFHFAYYPVSASRMLLVQTDANDWQWPLLRGEARQQNGAATFSDTSINGQLVFTLSSDDAGLWWTPMAAIGQIRATGAQSLNLTWDQSQMSGEDGEIPDITLEQARSAKYTVASNGRVQLSMTAGGEPVPAVAYLLDTNTAVWMHWAVFGTPFGSWESQGVILDSSSLAGTFDVYRAGPPRTFDADGYAGYITLAKNGTADALVNWNSWNTALYNQQSADQFHASGTYTIDADGRGVISLIDATGTDKTIVFWTISANRALAIVTMSEDDHNPVVVELRR